MLALARDVNVSHIEREENIKSYKSRRAKHAIDDENKPELANNSRKFLAFMRMLYDQYQSYMQNPPPVGNGHGFALAHDGVSRRRGRNHLVMQRPRNDDRRAPPNSP